MGPICGKNLREVEDDIEAVIGRERDRIRIVQEQLKPARLAVINAAAVKLLLPIAAQERGAKTLAAQLSYADLIAYTERLLVDPGAAWVLYKLDGGIDHLLLDEVQDTAPQQWEIANAIAAEFFAGTGAQEQKRSIFAVGDPKQSIFSFQGADLTSFSAYREKFKAQAVRCRANMAGRETLRLVPLDGAGAGADRCGVCRRVRRARACMRRMKCPSML